MRSLSIGLNFCDFEQNISGGGWPKFTKRKCAEGCISPRSMVAISRTPSFGSRPNAFLAVILREKVLNKATRQSRLRLGVAS